MMAFPHSNIRNIRLFYMMSAVMGGGLVMGNWIFFWLRFMTYGELGVVDALAFGFGLFMEVPTGAVADFIGKRVSVLMGEILAFAGTMMIALTPNFEVLVGGFFVAQIGWALRSGAFEAIAYDTLVDHDLQADYDAVISTTHLLTIIMLTAYALAGGLLYRIDFRLPHIAWALTLGVSAGLAFFLTEPKTDTQTFSWRGYIRQNARGFQQLVGPALRPYFGLIFMLMGSALLYHAGFIRPALAESFGFLADEQAVIFAFLPLLAILPVRFMPKLRQRISDQRGLQLIALLMGSGFVLASLPLGVAGLAVLVMIGLATDIIEPWVSVVINRHTPSNIRATTLSTVALLARLPYVVTAIFVGALIETGQFWVFLLGLGLVLWAAAALAPQITTAPESATV